MSPLTLFGRCAPGCPSPRSVPARGSAPAPPLRRSRRPWPSSPLPRPWKAPSLLPPHARKQRGVLAPPAGHPKAKALAFGRVAVERPEGGVRAAFVHEDEPLELSTLAATITRPLALKNSSRSVADRPPFFLVGPILAIARHMLERLTDRTVMAST